MVDEGSSTNIIFLSIYDSMKLGRENLKYNASPLIEFSGDNVYLEGYIKLSVTFKYGMTCVITMVEFLVLEEKFVYKAILGSPTIPNMR